MDVSRVRVGCHECWVVECFPTQPIPAHTVSPRIQCGCQCLKCLFPNNGTISTDTEACNLRGVYTRCLERSTTECGFQYSSEDEIPFCAVEVPSRWPPLFDLSSSFGYFEDRYFDGYDADSDSNATAPTPDLEDVGYSNGAEYDYNHYNSFSDDANIFSDLVNKGQGAHVPFLYTSAASPFADAAMQRFFRQPNVASLLQLKNVADFQVRGFCAYLCVRVFLCSCSNCPRAASAHKLPRTSITPTHARHQHVASIPCQAAISRSLCLAATREASTCMCPHTACMIVSSWH